MVMISEKLGRKMLAQNFANFANFALPEKKKGLYNVYYRSSTLWHDS